MVVASEAARGWQARIARRATSRERWSTRTRQLTALAQDRPTGQLREHIGDYAYWTSFTARQPELAEPELLSRFVAQFARLASNLGRGSESADTVLTALDEAIALQAAAGGPVTGLHLAKATYLRADSTESEPRRRALRAAVASAPPGSPAWADAMIARCWYEVDVSHYARAIRIARRIRDQMSAGRSGGRYECAALAWEGVARFTSFQNLRLAGDCLRRACQFEDRAAGDPELREWVAMAYHYLARIAEVQRRYGSSLALYVRGQRLVAHSRESLHAEAFEHLRIAEPLIAAGLYPPARDHLDRAYALVRLLSDRSAARLQVDLGYASLEAATGDPALAVRTVERARRRARSVGFWRGELLCEGYLLALAVRRRALWRLPGLAVRIAASVWSGELRRNNLAKLLLRLPVVLPVAVRRMSYRAGGRAIAGPEPVTACPCDLHAAAGASARRGVLDDPPGGPVEVAMLDI